MVDWMHAQFPDFPIYQFPSLPIYQFTSNVRWVEQGETQHPSVAIHSQSWPQTSSPRLPPILRVNSPAYITMKAGVWPIPRRLDQPMLHRVVMDILDVLDEIRLIAYLMLPAPGRVS